MESNNKYTPENMREKKANRLFIVGGLLVWAASLRWYNRRYYSIDKNVLNLALFSGASIFTSGWIAALFTLDDHYLAEKYHKSQK
jgi:hypothetical protein